MACGSLSVLAPSNVAGVNRLQQLTNLIPGSYLTNLRNETQGKTGSKSERRNIYSSAKNRNRTLAGTRVDPDRGCHLSVPLGVYIALGPKLLVQIYANQDLEKY